MGTFWISGTTEHSFLLLFLMSHKGQQFQLGTVKVLFELKIWVLFLCWHAIDLLDPFWLFIQFHKESMLMETLQQCYIWFITVIYDLSQFKLSVLLSSWRKQSLGCVMRFISMCMRHKGSWNWVTNLRVDWGSSNSYWVDYLGQLLKWSKLNIWLICST